MFHPRFVGFKEFDCFRTLKTSNFGKFISFMGVVVRASDVKPYCTHMAFQCFKCRAVQVAAQDMGCFTPPSGCLGQGCRASAPRPLLSSPLTQTSARASVRLQEVAPGEGGRVPRSVECELTEELADACTPGDLVVVSGVVCATSAGQGSVSTSRDAAAHVLYVRAKSVVCVRGRAPPPSGHPGLGPLRTALGGGSGAFGRVVASLAPHIYGHALVKAGIALALFGGGEEKAGGSAWVRGSCHVLLVGDPGLGKSQMLLAASRASPRGVYVCGSSSSSAGLTATLVREAGAGGCMEAGALVLADQGHCCIDEFDKLGAGQQCSLLEAMEQQTVSLAKSGVACTLPARTSLIAAANPAGGHYDDARTAAENIRMNGALLSRFDLVFILKDNPDRAFDSQMVSHAMAGLGDHPAADGSQQPPIPCDMLQKYIAYARRHVQPKLPPRVHGTLQSFYLELRRRSRDGSVPVTSRQLESLVRLTAARARADLRDECSERDAEEAVALVRHCARDTLGDDDPSAPGDKRPARGSTSRPKQAKKLIRALCERASRRGDACFAESEIRAVASELRIDSLDAIFDSLNEQGYLLKKGHQLYRVQAD